MNVTPGVVVWRVRRSPHLVTCVVAQVGEECFELRVFDGHELVCAEPFEETAPLLRRAEALRTRYLAEKDGKHGGRKEELAHS